MRTALSLAVVLTTSSAFAQRKDLDVTIDTGDIRNDIGGNLSTAYLQKGWRVWEVHDLGFGDRHRRSRRSGRRRSRLRRYSTYSCNRATTFAALSARTPDRRRTRPKT